MNANNKSGSASILDGHEVSDAVLTVVHNSIAAHVQARGCRPGLAVVLVGAPT